MYQLLISGGTALYICYVDESGYTGTSFDKAQPYLVMVGVLANAYNMHRTESDFGDIILRFRQLTGKDLREVKAQSLYAGREPWKAVPATQRCEAYEAVLRWFASRRHDALVSAIDTAVFFRPTDNKQSLRTRIGVPYVAVALHIALMVQRRNQRQGGNKGKTLLIYDQQGEFDKRIAELISDPPTWTDGYYDHDRGDRLDQIIDTAYFVRSHHASLIQIADLIAFILRRYVEIHDGGSGERYSDERARIQAWVDIVKPRLIEGRLALPRSKDPLVDSYRTVCPASLREILQASRVP
jgi:hypothetical protein